MSDLHLNQFLGDMKRKRNAGAMTALFEAPAPSAALQGLEVQEQFGIPAEIAVRDPGLFGTQLKQKKTSDLLADVPATASWLTNTMNAALAQDDLENLTWWEHFGRSQVEPWQALDEAARDTVFGAGVEGGLVGMKSIGTGVRGVMASGNVRQSVDLLGFYERAQDLAPDMARHEVAETLGIDPMSTEAGLVHGFLQSTPEDRQNYVNQALVRLQSNEELISALQTSLEEYSAHIQETRGGVPNFTDVEGVKDFTDWFAYNTGQALPWLVAMWAVGLVGGAGAITGVGYGIGVGDIQSSLMEEGVTDRPDLALIGGAPYAGLELLGPAARPFRGVSEAALRSVATSYFRRLAREVPANVIEEFINEAGQEIITTYATAAGTGEEVELTNEQLLQWFEAGMAGAAGGFAGATVSAISGPGGMTQTGQKIYRDVERLAGAGRTSAIIDQVDQMAGQSQLRATSPQKFQEALEAQGWGDKAYYVPAEAIRELFQSKGVDVTDETLAPWGVTLKEFEAAEAHTGDVQIPVSSYAANISGTEDAAFVRENATLDPEHEMSLREAQEFNASLGELMARERAELERDMARDLEERTEAQQIYDARYEDLRMVGRSPDEARAYGPGPGGCRAFPAWLGADRDRGDDGGRRGGHG